MQTRMRRQIIKAVRKKRDVNEMKVNNKRDTGEGLKEKRGEQHIPVPLSLLPLFRLFKTTAGALTGVFYLLKAET